MSRPSGPRRGSVRCCVSTAPMPARAKTQRLPTARLDVVTAAPSIPVRAQRAASAKGIRQLLPFRLSLSRLLREDFAFHRQIRAFLTLDHELPQPTINLTAMT